MERELRTALRSIRSSGRTIELMEHLLEDTSWATITELEGIIQRVKKTYHSRRILRALAVPSKKLSAFRLCIQQGRFPELETKIKKIKREEETIIFNAEWNVDRSMESKALALYDDEGFCFGLRPFNGGSIYMQTGDVLKLTYKLEATNGFV